MKTLKLRRIIAFVMAVVIMLMSYNVVGVQAALSAYKTEPVITLEQSTVTTNKAVFSITANDASNSTGTVSVYRGNDYVGSDTITPPGTNTIRYEYTLPSEQYGRYTFKFLFSGPSSYDGKNCYYPVNIDDRNVRYVNYLSPTVAAPESAGIGEYTCKVVNADGSVSISAQYSLIGEAETADDCVYLLKRNVSHLKYIFYCVADENEPMQTDFISMGGSTVASKEMTYANGRWETEYFSDRSPLIPDAVKVNFHPVRDNSPEKTVTLNIEKIDSAYFSFGGERSVTVDSTSYTYYNKLQFQDTSAGQGVVTGIGTVAVGDDGLFHDVIYPDLHAVNTPFKDKDNKYYCFEVPLTNGGWSKDTDGGNADIWSTPANYHYVTAGEANVKATVYADYASKVTAGLVYKNTSDAEVTVEKECSSCTGPTGLPAYITNITVPTDAKELVAMEYIVYNSYGTVSAKVRDSLKCYYCSNFIEFTDVPTHICQPNFVNEYRGYDKIKNGFQITLTDSTGKTVRTYFANTQRMLSTDNQQHTVGGTVQGLAKGECNYEITHNGKHIHSGSFNVTGELGQKVSMSEVPTTYHSFDVKVSSKNANGGTEIPVTINMDITTLDGQTHRISKDGSYAYNLHMPSGSEVTATVSYDADAYPFIKGVTPTEQSFIVSSDNNTAQIINFDFESIAKRSITGKLVTGTGSDKKPVAYANIIVGQPITRNDGSAYTHKTTVLSDENGNFTIPDAYAGYAGTVEIRANGYNVVERGFASGSSTAALGEISLDYFGTYSIIPTLKKEPIRLRGADGNNAKDIDGKEIGNELEGKLLDSDAALLEVDSIEVGGTKYYRTTDWFENTVGGQNVINFKNASILSSAASSGKKVTVHYKQPTDGIFDIDGTKMTLRSFDVTAEFDSNNSIEAAAVAYKPEGDIRVTAVSSDSEYKVGYAVLSDGVVSYTDDNGNTQQDINVVSWAGGKGELSVNYSKSAYSSGNSFKLYTFNVNDEDSKVMTQMLKNGRPKLSVSSSAVKATDVKLVENSIIFAGEKIPSNTYSDIDMGAYSFDYVLAPFDEDVNLVEVRGILTKRDTSSKDTLSTVSIDNGAIVVNGIQGTDDGVWTNKTLESGNLKNIVSAPVYALVPYKSGTSNVDFAIKVSYQNNDTKAKSSDVYKISDEILNFDITVPDNISMTDEMKKTGRNENDPMQPWKLGISIAAYKSDDAKENVITVWDNGAAIGTVNAAELDGATERKFYLTDMYTPGTHTLYATRDRKQDSGYVTVSTPKRYVFVSASKKDVFAGGYVWYHNGKVHSDKVVVNPHARSIIVFKVYGALSTDVDSVGLIIDGYKQRKALPLYDDTANNVSYWSVSDDLTNLKPYLVGNGAQLDSEKVLELAKTHGILTGASTDLEAWISCTLPGVSTTDRETLREQAFRSYYELRGLDVPDNDEKINAIEELTDEEIEEYLNEDNTDLPPSIAELKYTASVSNGGKTVTYTANATANIPQASLTVSLSDDTEYSLYELYHTMELERAGQTDDEGYEIHWAQTDSAQGYTLERIATKTEKITVNGRTQYHTIMKKTVYLPSEVRDALYSASGLNSVTTQSANSLKAFSADEYSEQPVSLFAANSKTKAKVNAEKKDPLLKRGYDIVNNVYSYVDLHSTFSHLRVLNEFKKAGVTDPEILKLSEGAGYIPKSVGNVATVLSVADYAYMVSKGPSGKSGDVLWEMLAQVKDQRMRDSFAHDIMDYEDLRTDSYELDCYYKGATTTASLISAPIVKVILFFGTKGYDTIRGWASEYQEETHNTIRKSIEDQLRAEAYKQEYKTARAEIEARIRRTFGNSMSQKALQEEISKYWVLTKVNGKLKYVFHTKLPKERIYIDPSGYVFEAVEDNRVGGVTATLYKADEKGDFATPWVDPIEEGAEENPQITAYGEGDLGGRYGWMVPEGNWKVKFTAPSGKYRDAETTLIQVPPEHTNVNIGLMSTETPTVKMETKNGKITLSFSKHMKLDTLVNAGASKTITYNAAGTQTGTANTSTSYADESFDSSKFAISFYTSNGKQIKGTVSFPDKAENTGYTSDSPYQTDWVYSDYFVKTAVFTPTDGSSVTDAAMHIGEGIESYSGVELPADTQVIDTGTLTVNKTSSADGMATYNAVLNTGEKCVIIATSYNTDGTIYDVATAYTSNGTTDITVEVPQSGATVILRAWDSLSNMKALSDPVTTTG